MFALLTMLTAGNLVRTWGIGLAVSAARNAAPVWRQTMDEAFADAEDVSFCALNPLKSRLAKMACAAAAERHGTPVVFRYADNLRAALAWCGPVSCDVFEWNGAAFGWVVPLCAVVLVVVQLAGLARKRRRY
jgi:hypothetical protein